MPVVFKLPDGKSLPPGVYAKVVTWGQGENQVTANLQTGAIDWSDRKPDGKSPSETFRVIETTLEVPVRRKMEMGFETVTYSRQGLIFQRNDREQFTKKPLPVKKRRDAGLRSRRRI